MPQISRFFGIIISMYFDDHHPSHFHARYAEHEAEIRIDDLSILEGSLPPRALGLVLEWGYLHQSELQSNWKRIEQGLQPLKIEPLQ
jgi:hypothetical protein